MFSDITWSLELSHSGSIYTREFGRQYKTELYLLLLPLSNELTIYWYRHTAVLPPTELRSQAWGQLGVLISNFMDVWRGLQKPPNILPAPFLSPFP